MWYSADVMNESLPAPSPAARRTAPSLSIEPGRVVLRGGLTRDALPDLWPRLAALPRDLARDRDRPLRIEVEPGTPCDGAGLAALVRLVRGARAAGRDPEVSGLSPGHAATLRTALEAPPPDRTDGGADERRPAHPVRDAFAFVGELALGFVRPALFRREAFARAFRAAGPDALPVATLVGFLLGLILAFESALPLRMFGAEVYVANLIGVAVVRELAMLVAAIVMAGRTASAFAAELGTMTVDEECAALRSMGLPPVRYLAAPRVAAAAAALPLLGLFAGGAALVGGGVVVAAMHYPWSTFWTNAFSFSHATDLPVALFKGAVFGLLIGGVGCHCGLSTGAGSDAVGRAVTRAVVVGILAFALADGVFAVLCNLLGV